MKLLILCTGNTCRSPMAAGIVKQLAEKYGMQDQVEVQSMGLAAHEDQHASDFAIEVMNQIGIDITAHRARRVMLSDIEKVDMCYVMTLRQKDILVEAMPELEERILVLDLPDPQGRGIETYRICRDEIQQYFEAQFRQAVGGEG